MGDLEQIIINKTVAYQFVAANNQWPHIASYDDWSDVYKVVEFQKKEKNSHHRQCLTTKEAVDQPSLYV